MTPIDALNVRPLTLSDRPQWDGLWAAYLKFYGTSRPQAVYDATFKRLTGDDPQDFSARVAERSGKLVGLVHFLFHRHCWSIENTCYLQDLYTVPAERGMGIGRSLIEAVYAAADRAGSPSVYWLTQESNTGARTLYDRVATLSPFIKYVRG